jgi:hypothetical protein
MCVYVINKNGNPLMPCKPAKAKHLLKAGKVKVIKRTPFTIKLLWDCEETFGYETKFKREQILQLPKSHHFDAVAICCEEGEIVELSDNIYFKKHVSNGDYQQTKGSRSEKRIPTGKLFGLRKFDYIQTPKVTGFIKGKRSTGFFVISDLEGKVINPSVNVKKNCTRLTARTTTLIERRGTFLHGASPVVSCA